MGFIPWHILPSSSPRSNFDASIELTIDLVPAHIPPSAAVERVRTAIEQLPGAFWISWSGVPHARRRKGCGFIGAVRAASMQGEPWDTIKVDIKSDGGLGTGA